MSRVLMAMAAMWVTLATPWVPAAGPPPGGPHDVGAKTYAPGEVLVQFQVGTAPARVAEILARLGLRIKKSLGQPLVYLLGFAGEIPVKEMVQRLKAFPEVREAEPNRLTPLPPTPGRAPPEQKLGEPLRKPTGR